MTVNYKSNLERLAGHPLPLMSFGELPIEAKKTIVQYLALEAGALDVDYSLFPETPCEGWPSEDWERVFAMVGDALIQCRYRFAEVDVDIVKQCLLDNLEDDFPDWAAYSQYYGTHGVPEYAGSGRWPSFAFDTDDLSQWLMDGWHRLHSYINSGHDTLPLLEADRGTYPAADITLRHRPSLKMGM